MSQQELADSLNVSRECYSLYETGKRHIPTEVLRNLSRFHQVSIDYLLEASDERMTPLNLSPDETKLLDHYKQLDGRGKRATMNTIIYELNESKQCRRGRKKQD